MISKKSLTVFQAFFISTFLWELLAISTIFAQAAPTPFGLTPNARQIEWYHREQQAFIHYGPNTFQLPNGVEWGDGTAPVTTFNPTKLDCGQWMRALKASGITTAILTIKHHDGFCLWPTKETEYCVRNSTWRAGKGDVLREFTDSCHAYGIKAAIYLSPWDRHEEQPGALHKMGTQAYVDYYCRQIVELCKDKPYGPFYEIWQDGAGDIATLKSSDFRKWTDTLHKYMPECIVWATKVSDSCGDVHWVGNEQGVAGDPSWSTVNMSDVYSETGNTSATGNTYMPAETNTSISNNGWFWHSGETARDVSNCWNLYFTSVARNTVLLLNFPPDTKGWISTADSTSGAGMGQYIYGTFHKNLLAGATATALHGRGTGFEPVKMLDTMEYTYFASAEGNNTDTIIFTPPSAITFDCIMLQEVIELGVRTLNWSVDAFSNNTWTTINAANNKQCIGFKRSVKWSPTTTATQVRLRITAGRASAAIHTFGVYLQKQTTPPANWNGLGPVVQYPPNEIKTMNQSVKSITPRNSLQIAGNRFVLPANFAVGKIVFRIFDLQGHCVHSNVAQGNGAEQQLAIPLSLKAGSYIVRCSNGMQTLEQKFIRQH